MKSGQLVSLSEQQLVDCSTSYGNHGCSGGLMDNAFRYIEANRGLDTEECYPYRAHVSSQNFHGLPWLACFNIQNEVCEFRSSCIGATLSSYRDVERDSEPSLQDAVERVGPISVAIDAGHRSFQVCTILRVGCSITFICSCTKLVFTMNQNAAPLDLIMVCWL